MADMDPIPLALKPADTIMQMASGLWVSRAIWAACRLRVPEAVGDQPITIDALAGETGTKPEMLRRLMNALAASGVFERTVDGRIAHNELSRTLRSDHPNSQRAIVDIVFGDEHYEAWGIIDQSVRTGATAFDICYGMPVFGYFGQHPDRAAAFSEAMTSSTRMIEEAVVAAHRFKPFELAVDVGGSQGSLLRAILTRHPEARGIIFDLPEIVEAVEPMLEGSRITAEAGDFFSRVSPGGDLYLMKFILHDWTDEQCALILKNVRKAVRTGGRVALFEMVLPEATVPHPGWFMDLNMMVMTGGRERNAAEYEALLASAGFRVERVSRTASPISVIEAVTA
jgi:hypothetical protein